jgi:hypothetical protein
MDVIYLQMLTQITSNTSPDLFCKLCDFKCSKKGDWSRHITTSKHVNAYKMLTLHQPLKKYECECGCSYAYRQSLHTHKKKCNNQIASNHNLDSDSNLVVEMFKQNQEFKHLIIEQNNKMMDTFVEAIKNGITNGNNNTVNSHNKTFNLQVFLNEDCKDAMNITDFVDSIKFQLSDLEYMGEVGYVNGISNIIIKNLKALDITKRPVHCTDPKRETIYIKDGGVWTKDDDNNKLRKMIKSVAFRNSKTTKLFKEKYPDCNQGDSKYSDIYNKIVIEAMGGGSKCNDYDSENKIMTKIAKVMTIDKQRT